MHSPKMSEDSTLLLNPSLQITSHGSDIPTKHTKRPILLWTILCIILGTTLYIVIYWASQVASSAPTQRFPFTHHCGSTPSEARGYNCTFDAMQYAWVPQECHDPDLLKHYSSSTSFKWYADSELSVEEPSETVSLGEIQRVFTTLDYRLQHCFYNWHKMIRSTKYGIPGNNGSSNSEYARRCISIIEGAPDMTVTDNQFLPVEQRMEYFHC
jgi:hypothetical protein